MTHKYSTNLIRLILFFVVMLLAGTFGYMLIEKWNFLDSLYMSVISVTTTGFGEVHPLTAGGRIFTIVLVLIGFSILAGSIGILSSAIIEGEILGIFRRKKMAARIKKLKNHLIICGAGKIGKHVIREMSTSDKDFIVVDNDKKYLDMLLEDFAKSNKSILYIEGEPTKEDVLLEAGIKEAEGLITCLPDDSQNLFVSITAKNLNPAIKVAASVIEEVNTPKFYLVGIDEVISGDFIIGKRLSMSMSNNNLLSFIEQVNLLGGEEIFYLGDIEIKSQSDYIGKSIKEACQSDNRDLMVIALKKNTEGKFLFNPKSKEILEKGDIIILMASKKDLKELNIKINGK